MTAPHRCAFACCIPAPNGQTRARSSRPQEQTARETKGEEAYQKLVQLKTRIANAGCDFDVEALLSLGSLLQPQACLLNRTSRRVRQRVKARAAQPNMMLPRVSDYFQVHTYFVDKHYRELQASTKAASSFFKVRPGLHHDEKTVSPRRMPKMARQTPHMLLNGMMASPAPETAEQCTESSRPPSRGLQGITRVVEATLNATGKNEDMPVSGSKRFTKDFIELAVQLSFFSVDQCAPQPIPCAAACAASPGTRARHKGGAKQ